MRVINHRIAGLTGLIVSLLVALLLLAGTAAAQPPGPPIQVNWGEGMSRAAIWYRQEMWYQDANGIMQPVFSAERNIAVIYYKNADGQIQGIARESSALEDPYLHSEKVLAALVEREGIDPDSVVALYSEFQPCSGIGMPNCGTFVGSYFKNAQVYYTFPYGDTAAQRDLDTPVHEKAIKDLYKRIRAGEDVLNSSCATEGVEGEAFAPTPRSRSVPSRVPMATTATGCSQGEVPEDGPLDSELSDPAEALDPGGIDFTSLQFRYLSLSGPHQGDVQYAMDSDGAPVSTDSNTGLQTAQEDSDAFFNWLTLPPSTFWVNLSPNSPPNIIDPRMALTDVGHVMLQSDLLLKEAVVPAENPAAPDGAQFAQGVATLPPPTAADQALCVAYRIWIVPGVATVHATKTQLYILSAPLNVKLAVITHLSGTLLHPICPQDAFETGYINLLRQWILPQLRQVVNTAPQFEPLRRVYMSRVAAQWVRQEAGPRTAMGRLVDSGLHGSWIAQSPWSPTAIWDQYLQVYSTPTQYSTPVQINGVTVNYSFSAYGGVDLRHKVREAGTSNRQFKAHYPGLAAAAKHSSTRPATADGTTLVGGGMTVRHASHRRRPQPMRLPRRVVAVSGI